MGIRFLCYHCEKRLNVKENQAGMQGRCPYCSGIVLIPEASTIPSPLAKQKKQQGRRRAAEKSSSYIGLNSVDDQVTLEGLAAENQQAKQSSLSAAPKITEPSKPSLSESSSTEMFLLAKPELPASMGKIDPIAEAPDKIWYFRSRQLGEKGPLKGKTMREYVNRGDVRIGCIVWREDWEDWVPAEKAFPSLVAQAKAQRNQRRRHRAFKDANYQIPDELNPHSELAKKRKKRALIFRSLIAFGLVLIVVLIVVLIQLVSQ